MKDSKQVSFVLGSFNRLPYLKLTIESIRKEAAQLSHEIFVIDGGSDDGSVAWLMEQKDIITIVQHNRGEWRGKKIERRTWGYFMNLGFKCAQGVYVCMLSDDSLLVPGAVVNGIAHIENMIKAGHNVGAGAFYFRDWSRHDYYQVGHSLGGKLYVNHGLYLRTALEAVDFIDEQFFFYNGDSDLCLRLWQKGYEVVDCPDSYVEHYPHANVDVRSTNYERFNADRDRYFKKWDGIYYDLREHNIGFWKHKEFVDQAKTGDLYKKLHDGVIQANPNLTKPPTVVYKVAQRVKWKYESARRKWQLMWR
jgi:GT2 family glycosyltransferase